MAKRGRPTQHTKALADEICRRIANGESLRAICDDKHMPSKGCVLGWVVEDRASFSDQYARAREAAGHGDGDEVTDIARRVLNGEVEPQAGKVAIDALKWSAGRKAPKVYGDKVTNEHTGEVLAKIERVVIDAPDTDS